MAKRLGLLVAALAVCSALALQVVAIYPCTDLISAPVDGVYMIKVVPISRAGRSGYPLVLGGALGRSVQTHP